jgi:hypothetical protein
MEPRVSSHVHRLSPFELPSTAGYPPLRLAIRAFTEGLQGMLDFRSVLEDVLHSSERSAA